MKMKVANIKFCV